jgi:hypothetical protein
MDVRLLPEFLGFQALPTIIYVDSLRRLRAASALSLRLP